MIIFGLFIVYQLVKAIVGGTWQTEALIIGLLLFDLGLTWKLSVDSLKLNMKFEGHIDWHRKNEK